jgi:hypothetical protein
MKQHVLIRIYIILLSLVGFLNFNPTVEAACGGSNCSLIVGSQDGVLAKGDFVMDLSYRYVLSENPQRGSSSTNQAKTPKVNFETRSLNLEEHTEIRTINELIQFDVSYGLTDKLTLSLNMPLSNDRYHEHAEAGTTTNNNGTTGLGDITLMAKYSLWQTTKHMFVGGVGIKFATGDYKLLDSGGSINEPTLQPGTGSYDAVVSGIYNYSAIPTKLNLFTSLSHRFTTENDLDYLFGDTTLVDMGAGYVVTKKVTVSGQLNLRISGRDKFIGLDVPSTGGEFLFITPGVRLAASDDFSIYSHVQVPIYQRINDENLVENYGVMLGASYNF